jgi:hypothetical protein
MARSKTDKRRIWARNVGRGGTIWWSFPDANGELTHLHESSEVGVDGRCYLGLEEVKHHHVTGDHLGSLYIDRELARSLGEALLRFAQTGRLPQRVRCPGDLK